MSNNTCCADEKNSCCCCSGSNCLGDTKKAVKGASAKLSFKDILGSWKVRLGIGRMSYKVDPGLYAIGQPDETSPVLVSANYKLTFDSLRKELSGIDCWLLILDTKGVNVWCAAGKGTFGTDELMNRIEKTGLAEIVSHRRLILPQLGAVGVSAHNIEKHTGFSVLYGPVRARDIKAYLASGCSATEQMRTVQFTMRDRLVLTPVELLSAIPKSLLVLGVVFLLNLFAARPFGVPDVIAYAGAILVGTVITPALLPFIPGRAFAWKGWLLGLLWTVGISWLSGWFNAGTWLLAVGYLLVLPSVSAYLAMNFTGSSTYTSFSGVAKEMKTAIPLTCISAAAGIIVLLIKSFIG